MADYRRPFMASLCAITILLPLAIVGWVREPESITVTQSDCADETLVIRDLRAEVVGKADALAACHDDAANLHEALVKCSGNWPTEDK